MIAANGHATRLCSPEDVANSIRLLIEPGGVTELRALEATTATDNWATTQSGYFDDPEKLAAAASRIRSAKGVYVILNPLQPALLARAANRLRKTPKGESTADTNIVRRRWLPIDCDPVRVSGVSSSDSEHQAALTLARKISVHLRGRGWPDPVFADSGNGAHLLYRIDLPADDGGLVQRCLAALAGKFNDAKVTVDTAVFNPARIWKLYGTLSCKGDSTDDRPNRVAKIIERPADAQIVSLAQLEELAGQPVAAPPRASSVGSFDLDGFIARHLEVDTPAAWKGSGSIWNLTTSPLCDHGGDGPFIGRQPDGAIVAGCHHDSCKGQWGWADLRGLFDPKPERTFDGGDCWRVEKRSTPVTDSRETGEIIESVGVAALETFQFRAFPTSCLPDKVAEFVSASASSIGCDEAFLALPTLACLGRAIGNARVIEVKHGWTEPAVVWAALVAKSGSHKTPAVNQATKFLSEIQSKRISEHMSALASYAEEKAQHDKRVKEWQRIKTNDPAPIEPEEPSCQRLITTDATMEAMVSLMARQFDGLLLIKDELSGWLEGMNEYKGGRGSDCGHWLSMFGAGPVSVDRKSGVIKLMHVKRASVSIIGGVQPGILKRAIGAEHMADGLCARLLMAMPPAKPVTWTDLVCDWAIETKMAGVCDALLSLEPATDAEGNHTPLQIPMSVEAKQVWVEFFNRHRAEATQLDDDLCAAWSKLEAYGARFALILQLAAWASGEADANAIDEHTMIKAIELSDWFGNEARRVYSLLAESGAESVQRDLIELIRRRGGQISARELARAGSKYRQSGAAESALETLKKSGHGSWVVVSTATNQSRKFQLS